MLRQRNKLCEDAYKPKTMLRAVELDFKYRAAAVSSIDRAVNDD
jgi:hypothetical protein